MKFFALHHRFALVCAEALQYAKLPAKTISEHVDSMYSSSEVGLSLPVQRGLEASETEWSFSGYWASHGVHGKKLSEESLPASGQWLLPEVVNSTSGNNCAASDHVEMAYIRNIVAALAETPHKFDTSRVFLAGK